MTWIGALAAILLLWPALGDALPVTVRRCSVLFAWCFAAVAGSGVLNAAISAVQV